MGSRSGREAIRSSSKSLDEEGMLVGDRRPQLKARSN